MVDERGLLNGDTEDDFVEYVLKNVNNLRQCCFFSWQGGVEYATRVAVKSGRV